MNKKLVLIIAALGLTLSGCQTLSKITCSFSSEERAADSAEDSLSKAQGNVSRGHALGSRRVPYQQSYTVNVRGSCQRWSSNRYYHRNGSFGSSQCTSYNYYQQTKTRTAYRTETYPIYINIEAERNKLPGLRASATRLRSHADQSYRTCVRRG